MTLPLAGIKIVDFSEHGFVPSCAAVLADFGADVVKIERLEGDPMRSVIANGLSPDAEGVDYLFEMANRNKRFVAKKLGITVSELERLITLPVMPHENFANSQALYRINRRFRKIVGSSR